MRCGKCKACQVVETSKKLLMSNPPFEHADQLTVETWNKVLRDNPFEGHLARKKRDDLAPDTGCGTNLGGRRAIEEGRVKCRP